MVARTPLPDDAASGGAAAIEAAYIQGWTDLNKAIRRGEPWSGNERNAAFLSVEDAQGALEFVDAAPLLGLDHVDDSRSAARMDVDFDGDDDLVVTARTRPRVRIHRNDLANGARFLGVRVVGSGQNIEGIGAQIFATPVNSKPAPDGMTFVPGATRTLTRTAGSGYLAQSSAWLRFGFDRAPQDERRAPRVRLHVRWPATEEFPAGLVEDFGEARLGGSYVLAQGTGSAVEFKFPLALELSEGALESSPWLDEGRVALPVAASAPSLSVRAPSGKVGPVFGLSPAGPQGTGVPAALLVFESDDPGALSAVGDLKGLDAKCRELEITYFAVDLVQAVDGSSVDPLVLARTRLSAAGWTGNVVSGVGETRAILTEFLAWRIGAQQPPPLPWLFVLDPKGRVSTMRYGPWNAGDLVADLSLIAVPSTERPALAAPFGGRMLEPPGAVDLGGLQSRLDAKGASGAVRELGLARVQIGSLSSVEVELRLGRSFLGQGKLAEALDAFDRALAKDPANVLAHQGRGYALQLAGRTAEALSAWTRAVELDGDNLTSRTNRGLTATAEGRRDLAVEDLKALEAMGQPGARGADAVRNALVNMPNEGGEEAPPSGRDKQAASTEEGTSKSTGQPPRAKNSGGR